MAVFAVVVFIEAVSDISKATDYYKNISPALAKKFHSSLNSAFSALKKNPFCQIRYDTFRLKLVKKFPYILHFTIDEKSKTVFIYGVRNAHQDPDTSYFFQK